jgi:hypothetical protein
MDIASEIIQYPSHFMIGFQAVMMATMSPTIAARNLS